MKHPDALNNLLLDYDIHNKCNTILQKSSNKRHTYPWPSLESDLIASKESRLLLAGYGSLLNPDSARRTIRDTPTSGHEPILAFGARRIFNYIIPQRVIDDYGIPVKSNAQAALNVEWTGSADSMFNARLLQVSISDFDSLRQREKGYHLEPVAILPWRDLSSQPSLGYALCADNTPCDGRVLVDDTLLPYQPYLDLCRVGTRMVDRDFEKLFLETTWLGNRSVRLDEYLGETDSVIS